MPAFARQHPTLALTIATLPLVLLGSCSKVLQESDEPALHSPEKPVVRTPASELKRPRDRIIEYTIRRGGTLLDVGNLYKIHHHEIISLNSHLDPGADLPPSSRVVVFEDHGQDSASIGAPHAGKLLGGVPMPDGPGRIISAKRWKTWASRDTIKQLDTVLTRWAKEFPDAPEILVGNLSARFGGPLSPHKTHQSGRDVDLSYVAKWDGESPVTWQGMGPENLDAARTWSLLKMLVAHADVEVIFIDRTLQKALLKHAQAHGTIRKSRLSRWLQVAGTRTDKPWVKHVAGHKDHLHVRFACPTSNVDCR